MDETAVDALADDKRLICNRRKLQVITDNAWRFIELDDDFGSFQNYLRSHDSFCDLVKNTYTRSLSSWVRWAVTTGFMSLARMFQITISSK